MATFPVIGKGIPELTCREGQELSQLLYSYRMALYTLPDFIIVVKDYKLPAIGMVQQRLIFRMTLLKMLIQLQFLFRMALFTLQDIALQVPVIG
jgi:hypothetical protein